MTVPQYAKLPAPPSSLLYDASLLLDFDGTLTELAPRPESITVNEELLTLLGRLVIKLNGRVAIVTGRPAEFVRRVISGAQIAIAGSHGHEFYWPDGRIVTPVEDLKRHQVVVGMRTFAEAFAGVFVEEKPFGAALHYRLAPQLDKECIQLARRLADETGFVIQTGKMVVEVMIPGADKGAATLTLMSEAPMSCGRPVFIGDDDTDEAGFRAAKSLGGVGILVGASRPTAATYRLNDVESTLRWLDTASGLVR